MVKKSKKDDFQKKPQRSWFCVWNNPGKYLDEDLTPEEQVDKAIDMWISGPTRTCAVNFEIGDTGNEHMHMVLEDSSKCRFSAIKKLYPGIHMEPTKGSKKEATDYIEKRGKWNNKANTVLVPAKYYGDIKSNQGKRNDLASIQKMIDSGMSPNEIMDQSIYFRRHESLIRKTFFAKRHKETPLYRDVKVFYHTGSAGSGKSYEFIKACNLNGSDNVYMYNDHSNGGFDLYCGEPVLFMDEVKKDIKYRKLLNILDGYRTQVHARYSNCYALWTEVHITSIYSPELLFNAIMPQDEREADPIQQLLRRIDTIIYHYKENGEFRTFELPMTKYVDYKDLVRRANEDKVPSSDDFVEMKLDDYHPF